MTQYFILANLDKKEYLHSRDVGGRLKLWVWCANQHAKSGVVPFLLRKLDDNVSEEYATRGRWAGDRIVMLTEYHATELYAKVLKEFRNISKDVVNDYKRFDLMRNGKSKHIHIQILVDESKSQDIYKQASEFLDSLDTGLSAIKMVNDK